MITIEKYKINPTKKIVDNLAIQIVYIPLVNKLGQTFKKIVTAGSYVYIGSILGKDTITDMPLLSSVSGYVVGFENKYISSGKLVPCIVIENDFKDKYQTKYGKKDNITKYSKQEFLSILQNNAIAGMSGSNFPTYIKYNTDSQLKYLIVNGVECDPYSCSDKALMYNKTEEILECIDAIIEIMHLEKAYIAINEKNQNIIKKFLQYINTYPNIKIYATPDIYPIGYEKFLIEEVLDIKLDTIPIEKGIITNNVSTIYAIYESLKYHKPPVERIVSITGDAIKNPSNYKLRIGSNLSELRDKYHLYDNKTKHLFITGGGMNGTSILSDDLIITPDLTTIIITNDNQEKALPCIKCGKCNEVCPVNLLPSLIVQNKHRAKELNANKCINCGLCSYICPSKIEVSEYLKENKED